MEIVLERENFPLPSLKLAYIILNVKQHYMNNMTAHYVHMFTVIFHPLLYSVLLERPSSHAEQYLEQTKSVCRTRLAGEWKKLAGENGEIRGEDKVAVRDKPGG